MIKIISTIYSNSSRASHKVFIDTNSYLDAKQTAFKEGLYIINGEEKTAEEGKQITRGKPSRTRIYTGKEAVDKFGEKGRKGVVVVTLIAPKQ